MASSINLNELKSFPPTNPSFRYEDIPLRRYGSRSYSFFYRSKEEAILRALPEPLEYINDIVEFWCSYNPRTTCAAPNKDAIELTQPFGEAAIAIPAKYKEYRGGYYAYMWLNSDLAFIRGRELWGYPKYWADIEIFEHGNKFWLSMMRNKYLVASATGTFTNKGMYRPPWFGDPEWGRFVWRTITEPDGSISRHTLTFQHPKYEGEPRVKIKEGSTKTATPIDFHLFIQDTPFDNPASAVPIIEPLGLTSSEIDIVVPYGKVVWERVFEHTVKA